MSYFENISITGLISLASGTEVRTRPISPITIFPGPSQIGSVTVSNQVDIRSLLSTATIFAVVNTSAAGNTNALATLLSGPNQIGSVTVSNTIGGIVTIAPRTDFIGMMTVTSTNPGSGGMTTLFPGPNQIGSVTISNQPPLIAGTAQIGSVTISNQPPLIAGTAQIGSITVSNIVNAIATITPRTDYIGLVTATLGNQPALVAGTAQIGSVTVSNFTAPNIGNVTLNASNAYIGLITVGNTPTTNLYDPTNTIKAGVISTATGNPQQVMLMDASGHVADINTDGTQDVVLNAGVNQIGSVTVSNVVNSISTIAPRTDYIGLMSVSGNVVNVASSAFIGIVTIANPASVAGMVTLFPGPNYIGLVTINPGRSMTTSFATVYSAAGNATLFVPPSGQRFFIHNLMINSQGNQNGNILSGTKPIWPFVGLATMGGFAMSFADPGLPATAINEALVLTINSAATTSIGVGVHFE